MAKRRRAVQARVLNDDETPAEKDEELVALGRRLLALREAAGLTQEGLAHAAGLHWTYVGQVERGERNVTYKNILKLARGLGVEPARLVQDAAPQR
ncbi:MAG TPA: helix-turn-helix transcriptional regulator [Chloroflexota bacterium]|nr:helix-turn-helix transcriptional regulator [Chloroflexota bacterium]